MYKKIKAKINYVRQNVQSTLRKIILGSKVNTSEISHLKKTVECRYKWYGSSYGGFYIIPALLNPSSIVYSFGIGKDISFDLEVIRKHHCKVYGFDPTPKSITWIKEQKLPNEFYFYDYGISTNTEVVPFFLPINPKSVSGSLIKIASIDQTNKILAQMKSFENLATELGHDHVDVVKMDIEGAEYEVLKNIIESTISIDQILVEFHDRYYEYDEPKSKPVVDFLHQHGYEIFASSFSYEEISFVHRSKVSKLK